MQGDPYGTQSGVYGLAHLIHSYLTGMRYEPNLVSPETAQMAGTGAVDSAMDQVMTEQWQNRMRAAREGQKAVGDEMSKVKRSPKADKQATQDWINKMRAAREGQKAVGSELAKPAPEEPARPPAPPPEPPMPMTPPMATEPEPWKTPSNTPGGFWGGHAVRHSLFGTEPKNPDPQE